MTYEYREDSGHTEKLHATNMAEAVEQAKDLLRSGEWEPGIVSATVWEIDDDGDDTDSQRVTAVIEPDEPECSESEHDWQSPHKVVGGIEENPGVYGKGAGVVTTEVCAHCGIYRETDTWATDPSTGEQGYTVVEYRDADETSREWVDSLTEESE